MGGCAPDTGDEGEEEADEGHESPEPAEDASEALTAGSVEKAAKDGCSTGAVRGLSLQIIAEGNCDANGSDDGGDDGGGTEPPPEPTECDVCADGDALDASCSTCAADVCAVDSYCCDVTWDVACVRLAGETQGCPCGG